MAQVHADPDKLRKLASDLKSAARQFDQLGRNLKRSLDATGWNDSERTKFEQDFTATLRTVSQFSARLQSDYVPQLTRKAAALDQFRQ